jgi:hypothetical protein
MSGPRPHRARDDFVHDPPHGIRAQHREIAHTEMGADIRSRYASAGAAMPPLVRSLGLGDPSSVSRPAMAHHFRPNALKQGITTRRSRAYNVQFGATGQTAVASWQDDTSIVALDSRTWRVRAKATGRDIAWTITATELSPDERCVAYSTINDVAHVISLQDPADTDMDGEDGEGDMEDGVSISGDHDGGGGGDGEEGEDAPAVLGAPFFPSSSFSPSSRSPHAHRRRLISLPSAAPAGHSSASFSASSSASSSSRELGVASHTPMDFSVEARGAAPQGAGGYRGRSSRGSFGIFSLKWSAGGGEVVAGCNDGQLRIFDVESGVVSDRVQAHQDDINSVCFAGTGAASDVVISGSDEVGTPLKVWDRRALGRPVGGLPGHVAGVTHVSPRGDGVHVLSAAKDQTIKLWDLRKQLAPDHARAVAARASRAWKSFDYRWEAHRAGGGRRARRGRSRATTCRSCCCTRSRRRPRARGSGASRRPRPSARSVRELRDAKVRELEEAELRAGEEDVLGLEVAVQDVAGVDILTEVDKDARAEGLRQGPLELDGVLLAPLEGGGRLESGDGRPHSGGRGEDLGGVAPDEAKEACEVVELDPAATDNGHHGRRPQGCAPPRRRRRCGWRTGLPPSLGGGGGRKSCVATSSSSSSRWL